MWPSVMLLVTLNSQINVTPWTFFKTNKGISNTKVPPVDKMNKMLEFKVFLLNSVNFLVNSFNSISFQSSHQKFSNLLKVPPKIRDIPSEKFQETINIKMTCS